MDWQTPEDAVPSAFVTESNRRVDLRRAPRLRRLARRATTPATGGSSPIGDLTLERGDDAPERHDRLRVLGRARTPTPATRSWCCTRSPATATSIGPARAGSSDRRLVGRARRTRQAARPRRLVRRRPEHARAAARARPVRHRSPPTAREWGSRFPYLTHPRPGRRAAGVLRRDRRQPLGRDRRRLDGRDAGARVGGRLARPRRTGRRARRAPAVQRRPDRPELGAERGDPVRPRRSPAATTTTPRTAPDRTAGSPSPDGWRC